MSTLAEIEKAIEELPPEQFQQLRDWMAERDAVEWDRQIEADAAAGKLDRILDRVQANYDAGKCTDV